MMFIDKVFDKLSDDIKKNYLELIDEYNLNQNLLNPYKTYAACDSAYPRPVLAVLGYFYTENSLDNINLEQMDSLYLIPQILRDAFAIHDDIIDEDEVKFGVYTMPMALSKIKLNSEHINKDGEAFSILLGDFLIGNLYQMISKSTLKSKIKEKLFKLVNEIIITTCFGEYEALLIQSSHLDKIDEKKILKMYEQKAADYCFAFPYTLGLILADAPEEVIKSSRDILLKIGISSQIIDDIAGVFPEIIDLQKETLSDLIYLKPTILLNKLAKEQSNTIIQSILEKPQCTNKEALFLRKCILKNGILSQTVSMLEIMIGSITSELNNSQIFGDITKQYLLDLVQIRLINNLECVKGYLKND